MHWIAVEEKEDATITTKMESAHKHISTHWCEILFYRRKFNVYSLSEISVLIIILRKMTIVYLNTLTVSLKRRKYQVGGTQ